jgi:hypothetical protein
MGVAMRRWRRTRVFVLLVPQMTLLTACTDREPASDSQASPPVYALIRSQLAADYALWEPASTGQVDTGAFRLEPGPPLVEGVRVIRGIPARSHWHPYMVMLKGDSSCPVGGFPVPDLKCATRWLVESSASLAPLGVATMLATLADEHGGSRVVRVGTMEGSLPAPDPTVPSSDAGTRALQAWADTRPDNWPADAVLTLSDGTRLVRLTVLSQETQSYAQAWRAVAYEFRFGSGMDLLTWSRRTSTPFGLRE